MLLEELPGFQEELLPRLAEAERMEGWKRLSAFLPYDDSICGVQVKPLTPRLALELEAAGSPFLCGGQTEPRPGEIAAFMWWVSTDRACGRKGGQAEFLKRIALLDYFELWAGIRRYLDETHADSPGRKSVATIAYASWVSGLIDAVASRYGWSEQAILDIPFLRIWQYYRRWTARETGETNFINALSDRVRQDFVAEFIAKRQEKAE